MNFMVLARIRLDLADGMICLPDEIRISRAGRQPPYQPTMQAITARDHHAVITLVGAPKVKENGVNLPKAKL